MMMEVDQPTEPTTTNFNRGGGGVTLAPEASRLFRVYKTVSSMLSKRGYMVSREMRDMTPMNFIERFGEFPSREGLTILVVSTTLCALDVLILLSIFCAHVSILCNHIYNILFIHEK